MFARVSTYRAEDADKILEGFQSVTQPLEEMDGFSHAYFLVDRHSDKAMSITLWQSEQALVESAARADEMRRSGAEAGGGTIESVAQYEVGMTVGRPSASTVS